MGAPILRMRPWAAGTLNRFRTAIRQRHHEMAVLSFVVEQLAEEAAETGAPSLPETFPAMAVVLSCGQP